MHGFSHCYKFPGYMPAISPGAADFLNNTGWISKGPSFPFCQPLSLVHVVGIPVAFDSRVAVQEIRIAGCTMVVAGRVNQPWGKLVEPSRQDQTGADNPRALAAFLIGTLPAVRDRVWSGTFCVLLWIDQLGNHLCRKIISWKRHR